jgi:hypothetical protein
MEVPVEQRIYRKLRKLNRFKTVDRKKALNELNGLALADEELVFGAYENSPGDGDQIIVFTDRALHIVRENQWRRINYNGIAATEWPNGPKQTAQSLPLRMKDGRVEFIRIAGGTENTNDLFAIMTFLIRVMEDLRD